MRSRSGKNPNYRPVNQSMGGPSRPNLVRLASARRENKKDTPKKSGRCSRCIRLLFSILGSFLLIGLIGFLMPTRVEPVAYKLEPPMEFKGPLAPNFALKEADRMYDYLIRGAEAITIDDDKNMYTGTLDGRIMKIDIDGNMDKFATLGSDNCTSMPTCGRPLGLRIDPTRKYLYVADAYLGVYKIDLKSGKAEKVFPFSDDFTVTFFNDLDFMPNGDIVISESSTKYRLHEISSEVMESSQTGRLILVSIGKGFQKYRTIYNGIGFSNGVQLNLQDKSSVLVAETTRDRILRVFVNGPRMGKADVFTNLPGMPDNILANEAGDGYWVGMAIVRGVQVGNTFRDLLMERPLWRTILSKIIPGPFLFYFARTNYGLAIRLDLDGQIVDSIQDPSGAVIRDVAQVLESAGSLYLTNYDNTYIGRLDQGCKATSSCRFQLKPESDDEKRRAHPRKPQPTSNKRKPPSKKRRPSPDELKKERSASEKQRPKTEL